MPRDGSPTRQRILDAAERLVIDNGFAATTVERVISDSQSSKGSFFHHFPSKNDLAKALVERYAAADVAQLDEAVAHVRALNLSPAARVLAFVELFELGADELMSAQSSCLYVSVLTERDLVTSGTTADIELAITAWRDELSHLLRDALPDSSTIDPDALADHLFVTFEGAFILSRATDDNGHMRSQVTILRQLLTALLDQPRTTSPKASTPATPHGAGRPQAGRGRGEPAVGRRDRPDSGGVRRVGRAGSVPSSAGAPGFLRGPVLGITVHGAAGVDRV
ncbi:MAG: TetR/AcrR family transcriptional regulator [Dermatophilaceae bacterium]